MSRLCALLALLALSGCSGEPSAPDLGGLDSGVRETIRNARAEYERRRAAPGSAAQRAAALGNLCRVYHAHHLLDSAGDCYRRAIRADGSDYRWHYYLAHVHLDRGEPAAARSRLEAVLQRRPGYVPARFHLARLAIDGGEPGRALTLLEAIPPEARDAAVLGAIGQAALLQGEYAAALDAIERALGRQPEADRLHYLAAMAWRGRGDRARAEAALRRAGETDPRLDDPLIRELASLSGSVELLLERGRAALTRGDAATAERDFRMAVARAPDDASARATLALLLQRTGRTVEALAELRRAAQLAPNDPAYRYLAGTLYERAGDEAEAVAAYRRAVELDPDYAEPRVLLGHAAMRRGASEEALTHYAVAARVMQQSVVARYHAGIAAAAAGQCETAARYLEAALERQDNYGPAILALVRVRAVCPALEADPADNAELARALYEAAPENDEVRATLALALAAGGDFEAAVAALPDRAADREWRELFGRERLPPSPWPQDATVYRPPLLAPR